MIGQLIKDLLELRDLPVRSRLAYARASSGALVRIHVHGKNIVVRKNTPDLLVARISLGGEFEPLRGLLPAEFDGVIVDAGGYIGTAAIALADLYPHATIWTIEPSTANARILAENIRHHVNINFIKAALAPDTGRADLVDMGSAQWGYSTAASDGTRQVLESVETLSIADLAERFQGKPIGILKLDIEAAEKAVFDSGSPHLDDIPVIFTELHDRIVPGCTESFKNFSSNRDIQNAGGEKWLSLAKR